MKTVQLPSTADTSSPAGASVRLLVSGDTGGMIHSTLPAHQINRAIVHKSVNEFWYILEGQGEIWRDNGQSTSVTRLVPGTSIEIEKGTKFQYRNVAKQDFKFICIAMPPWTGDDEATYVEGHWEANI